jgi:hypothetical protein
MSNNTQFRPEEINQLRTLLGMVDSMGKLKERNDELEERKKKIQDELEERTKQICEEVLWIQAEQQAIQDEREHLEKEIQKCPRIKTPRIKTPRPEASFEDENTVMTGSGESKRTPAVKKDRTPNGMGIEVGDELVMTLEGRTRSLRCLSTEKRGTFQYGTTVYNKGSPINKAFQELVVECGLRAQSRTPWTGYLSLFRDGVFVKKL